MVTKKSLNSWLKILCFTTIFVVFCSFETSFWPFMFDSVPAPQLWLILLIFLGYKWPTMNAILMTYFLAIFMTRFSYIPLKMALISTLLLYGFVWLFKTRIHSRSSFYFTILVTISSLVYSVGYILISRWLEPIATPILFLDRFLILALNFLFSLPIYNILNWIEETWFATEAWTPSQADHKEFEL